MKNKKIIFHLLSFTFACILFSSCKKKPSACFTLSNDNPKFAEELIIDAGCSENEKWIEFYMDGSRIDRGTGESVYTHTCLSSGVHEITVKAYSSYVGSPFKSSCMGCKGKGEKSELSKTFLVPSTIEPSSNSPLYYDQTLQLSAPIIKNASYSWSGPNFFTSLLRNPELNNVLSSAAGVYSLVVSVGTSTIAGTTSVSILPVTPPCSPNNNQYTFTGGVSSVNISNIYSIASGGFYEFHGDGNGTSFYLMFHGQSVPAEGIYTVSQDYGNFALNEVYMEIYPAGFMYYISGISGKVYVSVNAGKMTAVFCAVPFTYEQFTFSISGKIIQP